MTSFDLYSEPFSPTGNLAADGALNPLGRPSMDALEVLVREVLQNCWDAKEEEQNQVEVTIALKALSPGARTVLKETIFARRTADDAPDPGTASTVLLISDRGTSGLGGPLRADTEDGSGEHRDFVDFLRNIGQPPDKDHGGGTYGYGKAALYLASKFRTLVVHTHCLWNGEPDTRLLAARLGTQFPHKRRRYTGRHWWGRQTTPDCIDPVRGGEADAVAEALDFPGFTEDERGTTICILDPELGARSPDQAMRFIAAAILWNFWPKMLGWGQRVPSMRFSLDLYGEAFPLPHPTEVAPLHGYVRALEMIRGSEPGAPESLTERVVRIVAPAAGPLGHLGLCKFPIKDRVVLDLGENGPPPGLGTRTSHHAALLRYPELVVKYYEGPELPNDLAEYAGVFLADEAVDRTLAKSEPPTHDDWVANSVPDAADRRLIRSLVRGLNRELRDFTGLASATRPAGEGPSLGALGNRLGDLLPGWEGPGAGRQPVRPGPTGGGGGGRKSGSRPSLVIVGESELGLIDGVPAVTVEFEVRNPTPDIPVRVTAIARVLVDSGEVESDMPAGESVPTVLAWEKVDGQGAIRETEDGELGISGLDRGRFFVCISVPNDACLAVDLKVSSEIS